MKIEPRVFTKLDQLSTNTLKMLDKSMKNFSKGKSGAPINLNELKNYQAQKYSSNFCKGYVEKGANVV